MYIYIYVYIFKFLIYCIYIYIYRNGRNFQVKDPPNPHPNKSTPFFKTRLSGRRNSYSSSYIMGTSMRFAFLLMAGSSEGVPHLDVPLEVRINGQDQWVSSPTYKWCILGV